MLPYVGHPQKPDDALAIVVQPDMRFFLEDCNPRHYMDMPSKGSSAGSQQEPAGIGASAVDLDNDAIATNRLGLTPALTADEDYGLDACTPELWDLLRIRRAAKAWTQFNPNGQAEFIWVCFNTSPCLQTPDGGKFLEGWTTPEVVKKLKKAKHDPRNCAIQAGDILIMMTAKFARQMLAVIACPLLFSCNRPSRYCLFVLNFNAAVSTRLSKPCLLFYLFI